jgi:hypothetical protein
MDIEWNNVLTTLAIWITLGLFLAILVSYIFGIYDVLTAVFIGLNLSFALIVITAVMRHS